MTTKHELGLLMAALFSAFGRELTDIDVDAWHLVLGDLPRDEVTGAIWQACRAFEQMPAASKIRRLVLDRRVSATKNMTTTTQHSLRIAAAAKDYRKANPGCTADDVAEYVSKLERQLTR
jgi:hypothetical protein